MEVQNNSKKILQFLKYNGFNSEHTMTLSGKAFGLIGTKETNLF
jgi:hypothetical protein